MAVSFARGVSIALIAFAGLQAGADARAAPAKAAVAAEAAKPSYESLDSNKDGVVTLPEVVVKAPDLAARIRHCDLDHNSALSRAEYAACKPAAAEKTK
ncbi:MAG: hypothetical protein JF591_23080 [Lysobacter sp.]|nr:hypothetical protein [Lysobacter sp.]